MLILGIDPGYAIIGWGVIRFERGRYIPVDFGAITDDAEAVAAAAAKGVELADAAEKTWGNALYACFDQKVEEHLIQPTFIYDYLLLSELILKHAFYHHANRWTAFYAADFLFLL